MSTKLYEWTDERWIISLSQKIGQPTQKEKTDISKNQSLEEAKTKNINTFCLTVDKKGHDYLQEMCQGMGYEVLDSVDLLPTRLLYLYRKLTT